MSSNEQGTGHKRQGFSPELVPRMLSSGADQVRDVQRSLLNRADAQRLKTRTHSLPSSSASGNHFGELAVPGGFRRHGVLTASRRKRRKAEEEKASDAVRLLQIRPFLSPWKSYEWIVSHVYGGGEEEVDDDSRTLPQLTPLIAGKRFDSVWDGPWTGVASAPLSLSSSTEAGEGGREGSEADQSSKAPVVDTDTRHLEPRSFQTFLSVLKANTGIALLLYPRAFRNGGLVVTLVFTAVVGALTIAAQLRLIDVSDAIGAAVERLEQGGGELVEEEDEEGVEGQEDYAGGHSPESNGNHGIPAGQRMCRCSSDELPLRWRPWLAISHSLLHISFLSQDTADGRRVLTYAQLASLVLGSWAGPCVDVSLILAQSGTVGVVDDGRASTKKPFLRGAASRETLTYFTHLPESATSFSSHDTTPQCCCYMIYCANNIAALLGYLSPGLKGSVYLSPGFLIPAQCILLVPLCWIRKVQTLAFTNLLGVALIGGTVLYLIGFSCRQLATKGVGTGTDLFVASTPSTVALMLGTSLFTFEGEFVPAPLAFCRESVHLNLTRTKSFSLLLRHEHMNLPPCSRQHL